MIDFVPVGVTLVWEDSVDDAIVDVAADELVVNVVPVGVVAGDELVVDVFPVGVVLLGDDLVDVAMVEVAGNKKVVDVVPV